MGLEDRDRKLEISTKLLMMGKSLTEEGESIGDEELISAGQALMFIAGLILQPKDMERFDFIMSMFISKKVMDDMMNSGVGNTIRNAMGGHNKFNQEKLEDLLKQIRKKNNGDEEGPKLGDNLSS